MKRNPLFLLLAFILMFFPIDSGLGQEAPNDPGATDTLYFGAGSPCSSDGDTLYFPSGGGDVTIFINIWNDDSIVAMTVPLTDTTYGPPGYASLEASKNNGAGHPQCFVGSRVEHFGVIACNLAQQPPLVLYGASAMMADPMPPGNGLFATMVYTVNDTGRICLDTLFRAPNSVLAFVTRGADTYVPQFTSRCFHLLPYLRGDANGDENVDIGDVVYLMNYLFRSGFSPVWPVDVNCDDLEDITDAVYLVNYLFKSGPPLGDPDDNGAPDC